MPNPYIISYLSYYRCWYWNYNLRKCVTNSEGNWFSLYSNCKRLLRPYGGQANSLWSNDSCLYYHLSRCK